jgi:hypothetical protein
MHAISLQAAPQVPLLRRGWRRRLHPRQLGGRVVAALASRRVEQEELSDPKLLVFMRSGTAVWRNGGAISVHGHAEERRRRLRLGPPLGIAVATRKKAGEIQRRHCVRGATAWGGSGRRPQREAEETATMREVWREKGRRLSDLRRVS